MMNGEIKCPDCRSVEWKAVEQFTALTPCTLTREDGEVQVEFDMRSELARDAASSVTLAYTCANEECGHTINAADLR
jgi:hypothetical protein